MSSPSNSGSATSSSAATLASELRNLLCLEAPHLLDLVTDDAAADELEDRLLQAIRVPRTRLVEPDRTIFPGTSAQSAVEGSLARLETVVRGFFRRREIRDSIGRDEKLSMLGTMLLTRRLDAVLKQAFDRREIRWRDFPSPQKGFRSLGQEAIVGAALRLRRPPEYPPGQDYGGDYISPVIRDLGALLMFKRDPAHVLEVQYGKRGTPVGGRDLHTGDFEWGVLPPAAPLTIGTQTAIGLSYAHKLRGEDRVCVSFIGDGGASLGEWHEAINFAAVERLGMVFVIENNQWALGTHVDEQTAADRFALRAAGYGIPGLTSFGNDPEEIAAAVAWAAERARTGAGPALIELITYRRPGHAHHDDDRFHGNPEIKVPGYEFEDERALWEAQDPIDLYRARLSRQGIATDEELSKLAAEVESEVEEAVAAAASAEWPEPSDYRSHVYAPRRVPVPEPSGEPTTKTMSYDEAVRQAISEMMEEDESVFVLGEDVGGRYGGAFGVTRGLAKRFGEARCLNTPLAESAIVGCAVGAALAGERPVVEIQFADFLAPGFNALVNNAAKLYWRWRRPVPMVVRLPYGGATGTLNRLLGGGPYHSQCPEMWFVRTPGWKVVAPATPADAKGLMLAAIRDDNPVIFLEAKGLYGFFRNDLRQEVALGSEHEVPLGEAAIRREGDDLTLITYGAMVWTALAAAETLAEEGIDVEVIDLRSLVPLDVATVTASVEKTHRALVLHEDTLRGGMGGELTAVLNERVFYHLDAPVRRIAAPDTPVPYSPPLEHDFLPKAAGVVEAARRLARE